MMGLTNSEPQVPVERPSTMKDMMDQTDGILREALNLSSMIRQALYGENQIHKANDQADPKADTLLVKMRSNKDLAESVLVDLINIRDAMW